MSNPTFGQANQVLTIVAQQEPTAADLQVLFGGYLADLVQGAKNGKLPGRDEFRKFIGLVAVTLAIVVDYRMSLHEMIEAGGYDYVNDDINAERFPISGTGTMSLDLELVHIGRSISSDAAEKELEKRGLRPATIAELLAFGAAHPEVQRSLPIVALGSVCGVGGYRSVPYLREGAS